RRTYSAAQRRAAPPPASVKERPGARIPTIAATMAWDTTGTRAPRCRVTRARAVPRPASARGEPFIAAVSGRPTAPRRASATTGTTPSPVAHRTDATGRSAAVARSSPVMDPGPTSRTYRKGVAHEDSEPTRPATSRPA